MADERCEVAKMAQGMAEQKRGNAQIGGICGKMPPTDNKQKKL
jgi:hypothetical protein